MTGYEPHMLLLQRHCAKQAYSLGRSPSPHRRNLTYTCTAIHSPGLRGLTIPVIDNNMLRKNVQYRLLFRDMY